MKRTITFIVCFSLLTISFSQTYPGTMIDVFGGTFGFEAFILKSLILQGDINLTKGINKGEGSPVPHIPPIFGKVSIQRIGDKLSGSINFQYSFKKSSEDFDLAGVDNLNETPIEEVISHENPVEEQIIYAGLPAWSTLSLSLSYNFSENSSLQFSVNNILDQHYKTFGSGISAPGRNFITTFRLNY